MTASYFEDASLGRGDEFTLTGPPQAFIWVMVVELAVAAVLFVADTKPLHWAGYTIAALATAVTAIAHRQIDRKRSRESTYIPAPRIGRVIAGLLLVGLVVAAGHAYFLAQRQHFG